MLPSTATRHRPGHERAQSVATEYSRWPFAGPSSPSAASIRKIRAGRGQVEPERRALLDDQVLDELAAEQLVEEAAAEAVLHLERGPLAEQLEGDQQRAVLDR